MIGNDSNETSTVVKVHCLNLYLLVASCKLRLCPAEEVSDEVSLAAHVDVAFVGATAQSFVQGSTIPLLFTAVQLPHQDVVRPQHFVLTVSAKPVDKKVSKSISF